MKKRMVLEIIGICAMLAMAGCGKTEEFTTSHEERVTAHEENRSSEEDGEEEENPSGENPDGEGELTGMQASDLFKRDRDIWHVTEGGEGCNFNQAAGLVDVLGESGKNTVVSATSLNMALGLLLEGASGDTYDEIYNYLQDAYLAEDGFVMADRGNQLMNVYMNNEYITLNLANSVWTDEDISLLDEYINKLGENYNAEAASIDFADAASVEIINNWCADATNDKIKEIVNAATLAVNRNILINALYFNGNWDDDFEEYQVYQEEFADASGNKSDVDMMHGMESAYFENDKATGFMKFYEGYDVAFVGILPKEEGDFNMADLDLNSFMDSLSYEYDVYIQMPKFIVTDENSLASALADNGLGNIFGTDADFSNMCTDTELFVSDVIQKTYVDVNERGTEAAAVTGIMMTDACEMVEERESREVYLNRPFAFMIYDVTNDEILFMGKMNSID